MDFHDLQKKLFDIEPTDIAADKARMMAELQGGANVPAPSIPEQVTESYTVNEGSLQMDKDYSVNEFAALAGIKLTEAPIAPAVAPDANKVGMGAKQVGNRLGAKGGAGMMSKALGKVAQGGALPANLSKQIAPFAAQLEVILGDPGLRNKFMAIVKAAEAVSKKNAAAAPAQPVERTFTRDKIQKESFVKDELYRRLAEYEFKSAKK
tara:strand:- start:1056 stop:1679 length:624 start_codon:yes stop_codon:yes gene_type:complete